jgi:hypothetical protein
MPAAYVGAAAAVAGAAGSIANGSGGSSSSSNRPFNSGYLDNGDQTAWNLLNNHYAGQGANYGFPDMSGNTQRALGEAWPVSAGNENWLNNAQRAGYNFSNGNYVGSNPAYGYLGGMAQGGASNPYLDATFTHAAGQVRNALDSQFAQAGGQCRDVRQPAAAGGDGLESQRPRDEPVRQPVQQ